MRKTRFDVIYEELEREGKVHNVDDETRSNILNGLREVISEHNHREKIRQFITVKKINDSPPLI